ncbi:MAG: histone-fold-containing protein [Benniella sp.]|nr:MAG: histone-fold-containing protein [Benniella sp.]
MAGPSRPTSTTKATGASGRVQKKSPKSSATSKAMSSGSIEVYTGTAKGVSQLPVARVKRIIKEDKDVQIVSNEAVFLISIATEIFLEGFTAKAFNLAKLEKRKTVLYKDLATAVTQYDSLEFLQDVVPKTLPLKDALEKQRIAKEKEESGAMEEEDEGEQESNEQGEDSDEEQQQSVSEDVNSSRPMSDDDELSGPDDMDED